MLDHPKMRGSGRDAEPLVRPSLRDDDSFGAIGKAGNRELRTLLVMGQLAVLRHALAAPAKAFPWLATMIKCRPRLVVAVAMAAKTARVLWAMLARGEAHRPRPAATAAAA